MHEPTLKPGLRIQIEVLDDERKRRYSSRIEDLNQDSIVVRFPVSTDGRDVDIQVGMKCRMAFSIGEGRYAFDVQVAEIRSGSPALVIFPRPQTFYEQMRQHVRLDAEVWLRYTVVPREEMGERIEPPVRSYTTTLNISGGGLLIQPPSPLSIGTVLELEIDIPTESEPVLAIGQVAHVGPSGYGVEFLLIDEIDQDKLVKYVFEKDRLLRRR